jgi:hypothetical protein
MPEIPAELILNHLRAAIRNGVILLSAQFLLGGMAGFGLAHFGRTSVGAIVGSLIPTIAGIWVIRQFISTRGLMHSGFAPRHGGSGDSS